MGTSLAQHGEIAGLVARVAVEILGRRELGGVDEDRHHHTVGTLESAADQGNVPRMQGTHGRHHADREPGPAPSGHTGAQVGQLARDLHAHVTAAANAAAWKRQMALTVMAPRCGGPTIAAAEPAPNAAGRPIRG